MKIFILLSVFFFWVSDTPAQKQELEQLYLKGLQFYDNGDMDSAMICFKQSEALIEKYGLQDQSISSGVYIMMGSLHVDLRKPDVAHGYYQKALTNARKYDHLEERIMAFEGLNNLHWLITKEDWPFSYPKAGETVAEQVFFPIEKTEPYKNDSILVYVLGGTNDGIRDSTLRADFYRSRANRSANEVTLASLGKGVLKQLTPNRTILALRVFDSTEIPKPNDLAMVFAYTPVQMIKNKYNAYLRNNINIINNSRQVILSRRFMVHFEDSLVRTEVMRSFKYSLIEIVNMLNEDSSLFAVLREPLADGIFKGKTALRIMDVSSTAEINLFLDFVRNFPGNYMGGNYKFSEMYATWLINQAPLSDESILNEVVMDYLEKRNSGICQKLHGQIVSRNLLQKWLDSGMEALAKDQVTENYGYIYGLMYYGNQMKNDTALAWGEFLLALGDYYSNNIEGAESNLKKAEDRFQKTGLEEGLELCNATRKKFGSDKGVVLNVQTGHFGSYRVAMSPNAKFFATGGDDFLIKIWNAELGKEFKTLKGHRDEVNSLCYSQNGRYLFSASKDSTIIVWNTFSYEPVRILKPGFSVKHISINNDATMIAAACYDSTIKVLNAKSGEIIRELREHKAGVNAVAFMSSSDNFLFSCGNDSMVYKWNINDGQYTRWFKEKGKVLNMWISNNGRFMVSLSTDAQINVWDVSSYKFQFKTKIGMYQMATGSAFYSDPVLSPDSRYLLYISPDYKLNIADLETSQFISYSSYRPGFPEQMHFTSDGKGLFIHYPFDNAIVKADLSGFASIYNNPKRPPSSQIFNYYNPTMTLDFSDDGKELYVLSSQVSGLNLETGQTNKYGFSPQPVWNPKFIWGNKKYAAEVNEKKGVFLADRQSGDTIAHYQPKNIERIQAVAWSPSGDKVFLAGDGNKLGIFCFGESREVLNTVVSVREDQILRMHFDSADHKLYLFTKDRDNGIMYVLDAQTGNILKRIDNLNAL
ncbi:MAG: WD40 repeat domain-containing protein, partial [Chitinophagaceae bacterium]|nr:WD40 repeat domain-containing protein [Chitinophagaceae bacterium]